MVVNTLFQERVIHRNQRGIRQAVVLARGVLTVAGMAPRGSQKGERDENNATLFTNNMMLLEERPMRRFRPFRLFLHARRVAVRREHAGRAPQRGAARLQRAIRPLSPTAHPTLGAEKLTPL